MEAFGQNMEGPFVQRGGAGLAADRIARGIPKRKRRVMKIMGDNGYAKGKSEDDMDGVESGREGKGRNEGERWRCTGEEVNSDGSYHPGDRGRRDEANGDKIKSQLTRARGEYRRLRKRSRTKTPAASIARGEEKVVDARPAG